MAVFLPSPLEILERKEMPTTISDVPTPSFLVDYDKVKKNAQKMVDTCERLGVQLRPHMKTHKTVELGTLMTNGTNRTIEVSTLEEAEFYAKNGFDDILYAHPLIAARIERCKKLAYRLKAFHVMIENFHGLIALLSSPLENGKKWSVYLEIDDGCGRSGVPWDSGDVIKLAKEASESPYIDLQGLYLYNGKTYEAKDSKGIENANKEGTDLLQTLHKRFTDNNIECRTLAIGNTPSCSRPHEGMNVLTEFHPGNYIFYDMQQVTIGSCDIDDIACRLTTRIIGHKPSHNIFLIDCGFLALSYDGMNEYPNEFSTFVDNPDLKVIGFSQEIGKVTTKSGDKLNYDKYPIGSQLFIIPWHSCATACQHTVFYVHSGNTITDMWKPAKGW
ncbi:D-serine dehydratase-like [Mytilus galloprovincialis]|uniref:D-serine dehydratase-like n=1 Tax=Mytilus galloprovincialis TaxID=29158 RepID=UPI003F7BF9E7